MNPSNDLQSKSCVPADHCILYWQVGSKLWGTAHELSDNDYLGVFIEPSRYMVGLDKTDPITKQRDRPEGEKAQPGDTEITWMNAREFARRVLNGDPNLLPLVYCYPQQLTWEGFQLQLMLRQNINQESLATHIKSLNERFKNADKIEARDGRRDPKHSTHLLRTAIQVRELATLGGCFPPWPQLVPVRQGLIDWPDVVTLVRNIAARAAKAEPVLPLTADLDDVNATLERIYVSKWSSE